ncbi:MAG: hypothetical protein JKX76_00975 [Colwellia sp.]|nr:hypothetical protein [Colwellia sp.]
MNLIKLFNGIKFHYKNSCHTNLPSEIDGIDSMQLWYKNKQHFYDNGNSENIFHRSPHEGPAIICGDGQEAWYVDNQLHRPSLDGPAIIYPDGSIMWYYKGKIHRPKNEGPAVISHSSKCGKFHSNKKYYGSDRHEEVCEKFVKYPPLTEIAKSFKCCTSRMWFEHDIFLYSQKAYG